MKFEASAVKGFQDYLPPESLKKEAVRRKIEKYMKLYGFLPVETPIIELDELMRQEKLPTDVEDEAISDRFRLKDRAGRNLGLRYEFTFQLARIFAENQNLKLPFRRYQIGQVFRDEPVTSSRFRQFTQCDADIIGDPLPEADAECISLVSDIMKELNIKCEIQVNNRKLIEAIIDSVEISAKKQVMKELDKIEKLGEDNTKTNLRKYADPNQIITLFRLLEKPLNFFEENAFEGISELKELIEKCKLYGIKVKFNPFMIRGLSYYTGNIFEIVQEGKNTLAAGGRYDKLVGKYVNREIPAVGVSFGLERIAELAQVKISKNPKIIVISIEKEKESVSLVKKLRKIGISSIVAFGKTGKALEYANSLEIPYAILIGEKETQKRKFTLKNMKNGEEKLLSEKQLIKMLSKS